MHISSIPFSFSVAVLLPTLLATLGGANPSPSVKSFEKHKILPPSAQWSNNITQQLFHELEEIVRITDIAYCIGSNGISQPFQCNSHCKNFPNFQLDTILERGIMKKYSCGYIAVDHGATPNDNGRIILAFRGTHSFADAITDLKFRSKEYIPPHVTSYGDATSSAISEYLAGPDQRPFLTYLKNLFHSRNPSQNRYGRRFECKNCKVHKGFMDSYERIRPVISKNIAKIHYLYPNYQLHIIGHSLGGAIATLAALELDAKGYNPIVTTFGQPRVGNEGLANYINDVFSLQSYNSRGEIVPASNVGRFRRVTHKDDPVPLLPPQLMNYKSHGGEVFISKPRVPPTINDIQFCFGNEDLNCIAKKGLFSEFSQWSEIESDTGDDVEDEIEWENGELRKRDDDAELSKFTGPILSHLSYFLVMGFCKKS